MKCLYSNALVKKEQNRLISAKKDAEELSSDAGNLERKDQEMNLNPDYVFELRYESLKLKEKDAYWGEA